MGIEDRIDALEKTANDLADKVTYLENLKNDTWVSAKELATIMNCSVNNIYIKIRSGEIYATKKLGSIPRIPLSQFYKEQEKNRPRECESSMKIKVFGGGKSNYGR